jgi:hypothetical protein
MSAAMARLRDRRLRFALLLAPLALMSPSGASASTTARTARAAGRSLSTGAIVIAALAALLALSCVVWGLARRRAFEPHWSLALRHSMAEAGFRVSATWSEFTDWIRLGH